MFEVALGVLLFTALMTGLAAAVLAARALLLPRQEVLVRVNDGKPTRARSGMKLLGVLADAGIRLPSACGGLGTCGLCRVTVVEGGEPALATELARISRRDAAAGVRLACLTTVRRDLTVRVAGEVLGAKALVGTVRSARTVAGLVREIDLVLPAGETLDARAGCFVQVTRPPGNVRYRDFDVAPVHREVWDALDLWGQMSACEKPTVRAYSLANPPADAGRVLLLVRLALPPPGASATCRRGSCRRTCSPSVPATRSPSRDPTGSSSFPTTTPIASWCSWRRRRHGTAARHRARPNRAASVDAANHVLVRRAVRARPLLHGGVRPTVRRAPEFPVARRAVRSFPATC